jgi:hypothetical protein
VSYGTEMAQSGRGEPENRADFDWGAPQQLRHTIAGGLDSRRSRPLSSIRLEGDALEVGFGERAFRIAPGRIEEIPPLPPQDLAPLSQPVRVRGAPPHVRDVRVVGLGKALGGWHPGSGVPLARSSEIFEGALPLQSGALYQFKLVARTADEKWVWESGDDRFIQAGPERIDLTWRG